MDSQKSPTSQEVLLEGDLTNSTISVNSQDALAESEGWFKPCTENIDEISKTTFKDEFEPQKPENGINEKTINTCQSSSVQCADNAMKGFQYCLKHILEDKTSPYMLCSYLGEEDGQQCTNPVPKLGDHKSFCPAHIDPLQKKSKPKKKKQKKPDAVKPKEPSKKNQPERPGSSNSKKRLGSSSSEEEYNFFTDSVEVDKKVCSWLGNQGSDADSTDSEDENPLNHAGVWTEEEYVRLYKEKMQRLRFLYMQQFKRLAYNLKEERRKMLNEYDMDPYVLSKVGYYEKTGDSYADFVEDIHLSNYQKTAGEELVAEKMMREKRNHGNRKSDLPRCLRNVDGVRCSLRVLPFSKYCYSHIYLDGEQHLFSQCKHALKTDKKRCSLPAEVLRDFCGQHTQLQEVCETDKAMLGFQIAKKSREARKRKQEQLKVEKLEKREDKKETIYHNTRRTSLKSKEELLKSPNVTSSEMALPSNVFSIQQSGIQGPDDNRNKEANTMKVVDEAMTIQSSTRTSSLLEKLLTATTNTISPMSGETSTTKQPSITSSGSIMFTIYSTASNISQQQNKQPATKAASLRISTTTALETTEIETLETANTKPTLPTTVATHTTILEKSVFATPPRTTSEKVADVISTSAVKTADSSLTEKTRVTPTTGESMATTNTPSTLTTNMSSTQPNTPSTTPIDIDGQHNQPTFTSISEKKAN